MPSNRSPVDSYYDRLSGSYDELRFRGRYSRRISEKEIVFVKQQIGSVDSILEIGPGTGRFTRELVTMAGAVVAADGSAGMLDQLRKNLSSERLSLHHMKIEDLHGLENFGKFDAVVCMRVLSHVSNLPESLHILHDAVRPGGTVVLDLWNEASFIGLLRRIRTRLGFNKGAVATYYQTYPQMLHLIKQADFSVSSSLGFGYPRLGFLSLDAAGWKIAPRWAYSVVFDLKRPHAPNDRLASS